MNNPGYRDERGELLVAEDGQLADFPVRQSVDEDALAADIEAAIANRPELLALDLL